MKNQVDLDRKVTLVDALDKVLEKGAYIGGDVRIRLSDIDLIYIGLRLVVTSASRMPKATKSLDLKKERAYIKKLEKQLEELTVQMEEIDLRKPQQTQQGIAKLVLTLVQFLKEIMEKEAYRQITKGMLSTEEIEKLGLSFALIEKKTEQIKKIFGIDEPLTLDLGPLGKLV